MQKNVDKTMHGSEAYLNDMLDMSDPLEADNCETEIPKFFAGCNILITGASGFVGILLIEKLLRCCPDIAKMYIFLRAKKNKSPEERFAEQFDNILFDRLRKEQPNFITKIIMIEAELCKPDFGLSPEKKKCLLDTNIIFHAAATVRFNESIRVAVNINVRATKELLLFAKEMTNLKAFVHISTAFSHCVNKYIDEDYYPVPIKTDKILTLLDIIEEDKLEEMAPILIGEWPNSYAFTKAIAEDTVQQYSIGIPSCIVRPSIITSTLKDPMPGWINNLYGAVGVVMGAAVGLIHTLHCEPEYNAEIVPADYVISTIIAAAWDTAKRKNTLNIENTNLNAPETKKPPIYNYVSSRRNPINWKTFMKYNETHGKNVPTIHVFWYYTLFLNKYLFVHNLCKLFFHIIPATIVDVALFLRGREPMLLKTYKKIDKFSNVISYFSTKQWQFNDDAVMKLWNRMNPADRKIFCFDIENMDWYNYFRYVLPGMRKYILKDPLDEASLEQGRKKYKKIQIGHFTITTILTILFIWGLTKLTLFLINVIY